MSLTLLDFILSCETELFSVFSAIIDRLAVLNLALTSESVITVIKFLCLHLLLNIPRLRKSSASIVLKQPKSPRIDLR